MKLENKCDECKTCKNSNPKYPVCNYHRGYKARDEEIKKALDNWWDDLTQIKKELRLK